MPPATISSSTSLPGWTSPGNGARESSTRAGPSGPTGALASLASSSTLPRRGCIGAALGSVLPWTAVPGAYIWLALMLAGMSMWKLSREWLQGPQAAAAAVLFAVNPYNLAIVYYRSDFAELLAAALLPLLLWSALGIVQAKNAAASLPSR